MLFPSAERVPLLELIVTGNLFAHFDSVSIDFCMDLSIYEAVYFCC